MKDEPIFSGNSSKEMWGYINKIKKGSPDDIYWAVYILGCRCQELEAEVRRLAAGLAERTEGSG